MSLCWYVLHSKPYKENFLYAQLRHRDVEVYYPRLHVQPINPRSRKIKPFFPGYLFVHVDLEQVPLSSLVWVPGAHDVVSFDSQPAVVPDEVISGIQKNVARVNLRNKEQTQGLQPGDPVIITGGPFEGYQAIFDTALEGSQRVRLLIELLHARQIRAQVPEEMARPLHS